MEDDSSYTSVDSGNRDNRVSTICHTFRVTRATGLITRVGSTATASDELYSRAAGRSSGQVAGGSFYLRTAECLVALSQLD